MKIRDRDKEKRRLLFSVAALLFSESGPICFMAPMRCQQEEAFWPCSKKRDFGLAPNDRVSVVVLSSDL